MLVGARLSLVLGFILVPVAIVAAGTAVVGIREPLPTILRQSGPPVVAIAEAPGGGMLASGDSAGLLACYDISSTEKLWQVKKAHSGKIVALCYDRETLFSLGQDGFVRAWDAGSGRPLCASQSLTGSSGLWLSPDPKILYSALPDGGLRVLKRKVLGESKPLVLVSTAVCVGLLPLKDGHFLAAQVDGWVCLGDPLFGVVRKAKLGAPALSLGSIKVEGEEKYAVALLTDGKAVFLDLKDLSVKKQVILSREAPGFAFVGFEAKRSLLIGSDGHLNGYALPSGRLEADAPGRLGQAACPVNDGKGVVLADLDGMLLMFRHPSVQATFARAVVDGEKAFGSGQLDRAQQRFSAALQLYHDPAVRNELEQVKAAKRADQLAQRDKMKALVRRGPR